ncbi:MAG: hypothetical protein CL963_01580 [Euryarchaeota archaeon]|jgi:hypothetical protein|nr:hypothetical protein [Euryarchaeota archaeon]HIK01059.1 hypothetical protein [Candidatus Undinarchaeales archaeon ERR594346 U_76725]|tara:strand:+ start:18768 stop:19097 length:330 start_codon:yes stop_codon:yes gene_type:complete
MEQHLLDAKAEAFSYSARFPEKRWRRIELMQRVAKAIQRTRDSWCFSDIIYAIELAYGEETVNEKLVETLALEGEEWINSSENIESLGEDGIEEAFAFISKTEDDDLYF